MSQTSKSSPRDQFVQIATWTGAFECTEPLDQEVATVRQRARLMGHPPSPRRNDCAFRLDAAPPPSLETTDALQRRRFFEEAGTRARLSFSAASAHALALHLGGARASIAVGCHVIDVAPDLETKIAERENATALNQRPRLDLRARPDGEDLRT